MEKSNQTFQRLERLRQLNSQREWVNDNLYRLMYKEDLYILAYVTDRPILYQASSPGVYQVQSASVYHLSPGGIYQASPPDVYQG